MKATPTYAEFAAELTRRLCTLKFEGDFANAQMAGVFACLAEITKLSQEIGKGIRERMLAAVEDMDAMAAESETSDEQPTEDEIDASDEEDWKAFRRECGYRNI